MTECQRCGRKTTTITVVNTHDTKQQSHICQKCVAIVIRDNTAWQVKR